MQSQYIDKEGLERIIQNIKSIYAKKSTLDKKEHDIYEYIDNKNQIASDDRERIEGRLDDEITRATLKEKDIDAIYTPAQGEEEQEGYVPASGYLQEEIDRAKAKEQELSNADSTLDNKITSLEGSKVSNVIVNGIPVVDENNVARIQLTDFNPNISIIVKKKSEFPEIGDNSKLYIDEDTSVIWQWDAHKEEYIEVGKFNVLNVDDLPEEGDPDVLYIKDGVIFMWVWDDDLEHYDWKEVDGKDKELRAEFEAYKSHHHTLSDIDDIADLHLDWGNIDEKPETYVPSSHTHTSSEITDLHLDWDSIDDKPNFNEIYYKKNEVYNKEEVDDIIDNIEIPETAIDDHIENPVPHPAFESRMISFIENSISEAVESKAEAGTLTSHILNRENPHKVTKAQVDLGNVDNTSDANKPISNATQAALDLKVGMDAIADDLDTIISSKVLSAKQGSRLKGLIYDVQGEIQSIGNPLHFKGTVSSIEELNGLTGMTQGDCWQIVEPELDESSEEEESETPEEDTEEETVSHNGEMYAWTGTIWKLIIASVSDISSYAASLEDIYRIIDSYLAE